MLPYTTFDYNSVALTPFSNVALVTSTFIVLSNVILVERFHDVI